jgi:hypothetical protein
LVHYACMDVACMLLVCSIAASPNGFGIVQFLVP